LHQGCDQCSATGLYKRTLAKLQKPNNGVLSFDDLNILRSQNNCKTNLDSGSCRRMSQEAQATRSGASSSRTIDAGVTKKACLGESVLHRKMSPNSVFELSEDILSNVFVCHEIEYFQFHIVFVVEVVSGMAIVP